MNRRIARTLRLVAILVGLLIAAELALRCIYGFAPLAPRIFRTIAPPPGYALATDLNLTYRHFGRLVTVTTDHQGNRAVPVACANDAAPVLHLIGDSQTFGWGLDDHETIAAHLQHLLGDECRIINHAVPGYGPFAYAAMLARIPAADFTLVIQSEENDLTDLYSAVPPSIERHGHLMPHTWLGERLPAFVVHSHLFTKLMDAKIAALDPPRTLPIGYNPFARVAAGTLAYRLSTLYQPFLETRRDRLLFTVVPFDASIDRTRLANYSPRITEPRRLTALPDDCHVEDALRSAAASADHPALFLPDDSHLSPAGAKIVAESLAPHIRRLIRSAPPASTAAAPTR